MDLRPGEHNGENQEPPTTRSFSEDHPVRRRQQLQGASQATNRGTKPQPAEEGQGTQDNPRPAARVAEATLNPNLGQGRTLEGAKDSRSSRNTARTIYQHTRRDRVGRDAADRGVRSNHELTSGPDPNGDTKPSFRLRTNKPRPRRGDPIAKVGNPSGEE